MLRSFGPFILLGLLFLAVPVRGQVTGIPPNPYIEAAVATPGPLSLFCLPDGSGFPFTEALDPFGTQVDGTLTVVLWSDVPPWGDPIPDFPREDMWLTDEAGDLALCPNGGLPDDDTDAQGRAYWTGTLKLGGHFEPGPGNRLAVWVNGWLLNSPGLDEYRFNSADLDGNRVVNLTDVALFTQGYFGPYDYSCDFRYDGAVNLSDLALLASAVGVACP